MEGRGPLAEGTEYIKMWKPASQGSSQLFTMTQKESRPSLTGNICSMQVTFTQAPYAMNCDLISLSVAIISALLQRLATDLSRSVFDLGPSLTDHHSLQDHEDSEASGKQGYFRGKKGDSRRKRLKGRALC